MLCAGVVFSFGPIVFRGVESATDWQFLAYRSGSGALVALAWLVGRHGRAAGVAIRAAGWRIWLAGVMIAVALGRLGLASPGPRPAAGGAVFWARSVSSGYCRG